MHGGRAPARGLVPPAAGTLEKLEESAALIRARTGTSIEPMQIAALLLERAAERLDEDDVAQLTGTRQAHG
ncbi:MAG: hypothetical protein QME96_13550 [Myxococcota bacterium]|nr:hypothetical protein [Myxococcota bacterium]